jgi:DNA-directed RNA polymerase specialized sigma24 family protein
VDATVDALEWAWEHWDKIEHARNPTGYLYRVARRRSFRDRSRTFPLLREPASGDDKPWVEPGLAVALDRLSTKQRLAVVMVEGFGWTHQEMAEFLGVGRSTVQKHLERGLARLRRDLGVTTDV